MKEATILLEPENIVWNRLLKIAKNRGICVFLYDLLGRIEGLDGLWFVRNCVEIIIIDISLKTKERDFVFAHELGHSVLHRNMRNIQLSLENPIYIKMEFEADNLASRLIKWLSREVD